MSQLSAPVIMKHPPFDTSHIGNEHPSIAQLLAHAASQLKELPDFALDEKVAVISDFGGEHKEADFYTYSFLIVSYSKIGPFIDAITELRRKHNILEPYSEFAFKDLNYGPRKRALPEFLDIADSLLHGALVTLAVDKKIESLFGKTKKTAYPNIKKTFIDAGLGDWKFEPAEKALRISHAISFFASLTTHNNQRLLWYCDNDATNDNEKFFNDTKAILNSTLSMYLTHTFEILGFAKSFSVKSHLDDLLSIADLSAGIIQDIMTRHHSESDQIQEKKIPLLKWLTKRSTFLTKITIQMLQLPNGDLGSSLVSFKKPETSI
ncbi:hypothetical protein [Pseudomonas sp. DCB_BG]|uniref:hypothetical protein n=1 Tax=Pseudomonas sp. DCB_BG TaxID=2993595 RepID=UPI00224892DB|nr:hypothetical protein [Pseudomonas sp. DCB_BG]MCX2709044.1 hypothetical protein [Pseudomonas sp. DCB_BG]